MTPVEIFVRHEDVKGGRWLTVAQVMALERQSCDHHAASGFSLHNSSQHAPANTKGLVGHVFHTNAKCEQNCDKPKEPTQLPKTLLHPVHDDVLPDDRHDSNRNLVLGPQHPDPQPQTQTQFKLKAKDEIPAELENSL